MTLSLQDWLNEGHLQPHKPGKQEISQILAVYERNITDAKINSLSTDGRFTMAYNAALMVATAALAASGYRTTGDGHHYITIKSLAFTIQPETAVIEKLNKFRQKRNKASYERIGMSSASDVSDMLALAIALRTRLDEWLRNNHPELI
jgi:hypothetical protein